MADRIGIIGGSGLYDIEGLSNQKWSRVDTPFGDPSDELLAGELSGREVIFLPRHGRGHRLLPGELNHRANLWAMKYLGVKWVISISAVGSLQPDIKPCEVVFIDQFVDKTKQSGQHTFFGEGIVAHIAFADPISENLRKLMIETAREQGIDHHEKGTYLNMEGPAFSTHAESVINHQAGLSVVGMTNLAEAKCAREAEIAYASMAMVTDYDAWNPDHDHVTVEQVIDNLHRNAGTAKALLLGLLPRMPQLASWPEHDALKHAIITQRSMWPESTIQKLGPILSRYL